MAYWHVDKKSLCIYSQTKRTSSSEVASMIEGIIHHATDAEIDSNCVDTHGQSVIAFAFSKLLNFNLLPRLKSISTQKLHGVNNECKEKYSNISDIMLKPINWDLIAQYYDLIIQYALALKLKTTQPEAILKIFNSDGVKPPVYYALQELGLAIKTIFLCKYLHNKSLRQEIDEALNVVENWNGVNDFIFYAKKGVISTNDFANQELAILSLHILQGCLVYINTLMIQKILSQPKWQNRLTKEDKRAISPLFHENTNPYGIFILDMKKRINFELEVR
jgi:TnpA family transposase